MINQAGLDLLKAREGCRLDAYQDGAGVWTIGWGHTDRSVIEGLEWTQDQCDAALVADVNHVSAQVALMVPRSLNANQFAALVVFAYNVGAAAFGGSSVCQAVNATAGLTHADVPERLALWDKVRDPHTKALVPSAGLLARRQAEGALWCRPVVTGVSTAEGGE